MIFTCFFQNNTGFFVSVAVASNFGHTAISIAPGSFGPVTLRTGIKAIAVFDLSSGSLLSQFPIFVSTSQVFDVLPGGIAVAAPVPGAAPTMPVPPPSGLAF